MFPPCLRSRKPPVEEKKKKDMEETRASIEKEEAEEEEEEDDDPEEKFREYTVVGRWEKVYSMYERKKEFHTMVINKSRGTALHVAVNDGKEDVVKRLVEIIIKHENVKALEVKNEVGDTPLHLAAARGYKRICEFIIEKEGKRTYLINKDNNKGETPLFHAALSWQKQTFVYLCSLMPAESVNYSRDLIRTDGDSILHCAIRREFFDLALIIMHKYPDLFDIQNQEGFSPLKLLATRPSAFWSGCKLIWFKRILYHCIPVGDLDIKRTISDMEKSEEAICDKKFPDNYNTCYDLFRTLRKLANLMFIGPPQPLKQRLQSRFDEFRQFAVALVSGKVGDHKKHEDSKKDEHEISIHDNEHEAEGSRQNENANKEGGGSCQNENAKKEGGGSYQNENANKEEHFPPNYATSLRFLKLAYIYILGLSGVGIRDITTMKQKHKWSGQLLREFMKKPYESYLGSGGATDHSEIYGENIKPNETKPDIETAILAAARNGIVEMVDEFLTKITSTIHETNSENKNVLLVAVENRQPLFVAYKPAGENIKPNETDTKPDIKETAILAAARNGIVEMVDEFLTKITSTIHETNSENKNVLLVAVENRQPLVVEALRNRFEKDEKAKVYLNNLILGEDNEQNTVLHLAARAPSDMVWQISGDALKMMWDIKWFQYIKELVPEHFTIRTNQEGKTAGEIFKNTHKEHVKDSREWLKDTSESCSLVAALLAGVSFATSSTFPGGTNDNTGKPVLEGKPEFESFAIASLIGLCFSVTALIMFLSILTSRKEAKDFRKDLPIKLLLGLSSLFISIAAMFVSFCSGHFFVLEEKYNKILFLIYALTCLPVSFYAVAQFPLYTDLLIAILKKVPQSGDKGDDL